MKLTKNPFFHLSSINKLQAIQHINLGTMPKIGSPHEVFKVSKYLSNAIADRTPAQAGLPKFNESFVLNDNLRRKLESYRQLILSEGFKLFYSRFNLLGDLHDSIYEDFEALSKLAKDDRSKYLIKSICREFVSLVEADLYMLNL